MSKAKVETKKVVTKNPNEVIFAHAPVYNLQTIRKLALALIVKAGQDPKKVAVIEETLQVLSEFLAVRAKAGSEAREAAIASAEALAAAKAEAAAKHRLADAQGSLADAKKAQSHWSKVVETLTGK